MRLGIVLLAVVAHVVVCASADPQPAALEPPAFPLFFSRTSITTISLETRNGRGLAALDTQAAAACERLAQAPQSRQHHVAVPVQSSELRPDASTLTACHGRQPHDKCYTDVQGRRTLGACSDSFLPPPPPRGNGLKPPLPPLLCVPAAVLLAPHACAELRVGDECAFSADGTEYSGICGDDAVGSGRLGCVTPTGAAYLRILDRKGLDLQQSAYEPETVTIGFQGHQWRGALAVRTGGASLCQALAAGSQKLPLHLDLRQSTYTAAAHQAPPPAHIRGEALLPPGLLLATRPVADASHMRTHLAHTLQRSLQLPVARSALCRLEVDGVYHGLYTCIEDLTAANLSDPHTLIDTREKPGPHSPAIAARASQAAAAPGTAAPGTAAASGSSGPELRRLVRTLNLTAADGATAVLKTHERVQVLHRNGPEGGVEPTASVRVLDSGAVVHGVPEAALAALDCAGAGDGDGTVLYEPRTSLQHLHPHEFLPVGGAAPQPWWLHALQLFRAVEHSEAMHRTDPVGWRRQLEQVFDADTFLGTLALNTLLGNSDGYGRVPHNFFLAGTGCATPLVFVPFDFDSILGGGYHTSGTPTPEPELDLGDITHAYPLIRHLLDDAHYRQVYRRKLGGMLTRLEYVAEEVIRAFRHEAQPHLHLEDEDFTNADNEDLDAAITAVEHRLARRVAAAREWLERPDRNAEVETVKEGKEKKKGGKKKKNGKHKAASKARDEL